MPRSFSFPDFALPEEPSADVLDAFRLYSVWEQASKSIGVPGMTFESKSIPCGIAGYDDFYSLADMVPLYRNGVVTTTTLFDKIASNWLKLEAINRVF